MSERKQVPSIVYVVVDPWQDTFLTARPSAAVTRAIEWSLREVPEVAGAPTDTVMAFGRLNGSRWEAVIRAEVVEENLTPVDLDAPEVRDALELARRRLYDALGVAAQLGLVRLKPYDYGITPLYLPTAQPEVLDA